MKAKPCPCCGGASCLHSNYLREPDLYYVFVRCTVCGTEGKKIPTWDRPSEYEWRGNEANLAISAWNMRTGK